MIITCSSLVRGQNPNGDYNPYVGSGELTPSPIWTVQSNGAGAVSFEIGNTGSDPLDVYDGQHITLTLTLSYGEPDAADPVDAVAGSAAGHFLWSYYDGTYTAKQISSIPAGYSGVVTIDYRVLRNSAAPGINGFNVNVSPAPYQVNSNVQADDAVSSYTYTSDESLSKPTNFGLYQLLIEPNPSNGVFLVHLDSSAYGEFILEIISAKGNIVVQRAVEFHSDPSVITGDFSFLDNGIYTIRIYNQSRFYYGKLMIIQ